jgi:hypothetical protein
MFWFCDCWAGTLIASAWSQLIRDMMTPWACSITARLFIASSRLSLNVREGSPVYFQGAQATTIV